MRKLLALTVLGFLLISGTAYAQQTTDADMQRMQAIPQEIDELHKEAHKQMLAALTPHNRSLVAELESSQLTQDAAAKRLDDALSSRESQAVIAIDGKRRVREHAIVSQAGPGLMLREPDGKPDAGQLILNQPHLTLMTPQ